MNATTCPPAGCPAQTELTTDRAVFTEAYAVLPRGTMRDITASRLPHWDGTRLWVLARPLSGFAETFSQYVVEVAPGGGSDRPEDDPAAEAVLFVVGGSLTLTLDGAAHDLTPGSYASWRREPTGRCATTAATRRPSTGSASATRSSTDVAVADGVRDQGDRTSSRGRCPTPTAPGRPSGSSTPTTCGHDMHVNIVSFAPGGSITFPETHVMEHGLYVLEGKAVYLLNTDWVEVQAGDFMWLRAFCPQACYAGGPGRFRYLLYKDVNRHAALEI